MKKSMLLLILSLILAIYFIIWVYWYDVWIWWTIFCIWVIVLWLYSVAKPIKSSWQWWIIIWTWLAISVSHSIYAQDHFDLINILFTIPLVMYWIYIVSIGSWNIVTDIANFFNNFDSLFISKKWVEELNHIASISHIKSIKTDSKVRYWILAWAILLLFLIPLLSEADPVFKSMFGGLSDMISVAWSWFIATINLRKILLVAIVTWLLFNRSINTTSNIKEYNNDLKVRIKLDQKIYTIALGFVALVYILFAIVQFKYLLLWSQLPDGLTYSTYAVNGFWQLIVVSIINIILMLLATHHKEEWTTTVYYIITTIVFVCSLIIRYSSFMRLNLYISTYGLTFMRVLPWSFLMYLIYGLIVTYIGIYNPKWKRINLLAYGLLIWYAILNLVGVDRIISSYNIGRYTTGKTKLIDAEYLLEDLSIDQRLWTYTLTDLEQSQPLLIRSLMHNLDKNDLYPIILLLKNNIAICF